jgi:RimJ/RimL family protein N-acetyltransferase
VPTAEIVDGTAVKVLETERLVLRWLMPDDAAFVHELMNDPGWIRHIGDRGIRSIEDARHYIDERLHAQCVRLGYGLNRVALRASDTPVGICGLVRRDWLDSPDLGYAFLPQYRGRGCATEAAAAMLEHARDVLGMGRIAAIVSPDNEDSIRVLERVGMKFERRVTPPDESSEVCLYGRALA